MPIQFRCIACQQLLGIARRKAGKVVNCPTCGKKTLVPKVDPIEEEVTAPLPPPIPPIQRHIPKPVSIFDRVDVEKLLQPPRKPEIVEESGDPDLRQTATAVAEPPKRLVSVPDFDLDVMNDEPKALTPIPKVDDDQSTPVPIVEEPFAQLAQVPTLSPVRKSVTNLQLALYALGTVSLAIGAFFAGHWVGHHRPLF